MTGYIRNDTTNNIANGNVINAADLDGEFDAIQTAFDASTGHTHDGTVGGGAPIAALGPAQDVVITTSVLRPKTDNTVDLGTSTLEFKDLYLDGTAKVDTLTVDESATIAANLTVDTTTFVVDATNNRVGIGTASPSTTLHISTATPIITLTDTDNPHSATINTNSATGSLAISADTGNAVADSAIILNIDNSEKVRILADGSVGIGTATPSATLDVVGGAEINGDLTVTGNTTLGNAATDTVTFTADVASHLIPSSDNTYDLGASGSEWKDLYIDGTANIDALVADAATIITSTGGVLTLQRDDTAITTGETLGEIDFQAPNVSGGGDAIVVAATIRAVARDTFDAAVNKTSLLFETANSGAVTTRMEIDGTGNVAVDTDTLYVDAVNDRVGINNASPAVALDVTGAATISGDLTIADKIVHSGDTNTAIRFPAADTVTVETSGAERMRVDSSGNVGVGTATPAVRLEASGGIADVIAGTAQVIARSGDNTNFNQIRVRATATESRLESLAAGTGTSSPLVIHTGGSERMRIDSSGNVGIGTSSPDFPLDVSSTGVGSTIVSRFYVTDNTVGLLRVGNSTTGDGSTAPAFGANGTSAVIHTNNTERMRIDSSGNLLVGTTAGLTNARVDIRDVNRTGNASNVAILSTTTQAADIGGTIGLGGLYDGSNSTVFGVIRGGKENSTSGNYAGYLSFGTVLNGNSITERMRIDASGNVGIGTTAPAAKLELASGNAGLGILAATNRLRFTDNDPTLVSGQTTGAIEWYTSDTDAPGVHAYIGTLGANTGAADLTFGTGVGGSTSERMRINSAGNVGIGTATPTSPLHVYLTDATTYGDGTAALDTTNILRVQNGSQVNDTYSGIQLVSENGAGTTGMWTIASVSTSSNYDNHLVFHTRTGSTTYAERMRIDTSGNLGLGVTPSAWATLVPAIQIGGGGSFIAAQGSGSGNSDSIYIGTNAHFDGTDWKYKETNHASYFLQANGVHQWFTAPSGTAGNTITFTEAARIDSGGIFNVGCTALSTTSTTDTGAQIGSSGAGIFFRASNTPLIVMRQTNDGTLVDLRQGGASEGTISVSGTTVSYNGGHLSRWAQFPDNSRPELLKGTVMSNLDQMSQWGEEDNEQLNCVQVSTVEGDANVAGVFVAWDSTDDGYNDILLAMTGDMVIRIGAGVTVARGDLLMSAGDGTAEPQGDDIVRSKTVAKVTSTHVSHTYADGSYAVPCVLMAC